MSDLYFGTTQTGSRIHFGTEVWYAEKKEVWVVTSHCGNQIRTHSLDRPFPARVKEFCRSCFRTEAWLVYEETMLARASESQQEGLRSA